MGNCFSDESKKDAPGKTSRESKYLANSNFAGDSSTGSMILPGGGKRAVRKPRVEMSWGFMQRSLPPPDPNRVLYQQSQDPNDYEVHLWKPDLAIQALQLHEDSAGGSAMTGTLKEGTTVTDPQSMPTESASTVGGAPKDRIELKMRANAGYLPWYRLPGQVNDQRINVQACEQVAFMILDQCDSVQVDDCVNCIFYIGPCTGSVFIRNCKKCKFVIACGQLRTRDVKSCQFSLFCQSRPVLENSKDIGIGPYNHTGYYDLRSHFAKAKLSVFNNKYTMVHDFTPKADNYHFISPQEAGDLFPSLRSFGALDRFHKNEDGATASSGITTTAAGVILQDGEVLVEVPIVPLTHGVQSHNKPHYFIIVFKAGYIDEAQNFIDLVDIASREEIELAELESKKRSRNDKVSAGGEGRDGLLLMNTAEQVLTSETIGMIESCTSHPPLSTAEREFLLGPGPVIGVCFAANVPLPEIWSDFMRTPTAKTAVALSRTGESNVVQLAEAIFEKIPLSGMGFGSSF